ncbi:MAG TPA: hypothetical protein VK707_11385 [Solirubrobacteraceae bacterium]|nr:hypothetical protein [Solirubrobacteraceae bacterium]
MPSTVDDAGALLLVVETFDDELLDQCLIRRAAQLRERPQASHREAIDADRDRRRRARSYGVLHLQGLLAPGLLLEELIGIAREPLGRRRSRVVIRSAAREQSIQRLLGAGDVKQLVDRFVSSR